ncbi:MAG: alpha/beta hydrolase-fold protein [Saprospiraceae bacterium]
MKHLHIIIFTLLLWSCKQSSTLPKSNDHLVKIVLDTEEPLAETDTIFLAGNIPALGFWYPKGLAMKKRSETRWEQTFPVSDSSRHLEFKFTLGSFDREAISNKGKIPGNSILEVARDTEVYFVIEDFKNPMAPLMLSSGTADFRIFHPNNGLADRKITVWLPEGYRKDATTKYPVIYVHDGQNQFDSTKTFNHQEWKLDETIHSLSMQGKISTPIVVAIDNTSARTQEYGSVIKESPYADFIIKQVKPWVDSAYHTLSDRKHTATMGSSMGGLIALNLAWYHDDTFSGAACLSPAFKIDQFDILKEIKKYDGPKKNINLYVDDGTEGLEAKLRPGIDETVQYLKTKGYQINYQIAQGAEHNEAAWAKRIDKPLIQFFGK